MFYEDVPLVHTMLVIAIVIGLQRLLGSLIRNSEPIEKFIEGRTKLLVNKSQIHVENLRSERLSPSELFELLRTEGVSQLGQVRQAFLERSGKLSVIRWQSARPGLSVLPQNYDIDLDVAFDPQIRCCSVCGALQRSGQCDEVCQEEDAVWVRAVSA